MVASEVRTRALAPAWLDNAGHGAQAVDVVDGMARLCDQLS